MTDVLGEVIMTFWLFRNKISNSVVARQSLPMDCTSRGWISPLQIDISLIRALYRTFFGGRLTFSITTQFLTILLPGSDDSWATPATTHTYFRNIRLWGATAPSNLTGKQVKSAATRPAAMALYAIGISLGTFFLALYV